MPGWQFGLAPAVLAQRKQGWPETQHRGVTTRRLEIAEKVKIMGTLPPKEALEMREVFDLYDKDGTDELDWEQLKELMAALNDGIEPEPAEVQKVLQQHKIPGSKGLSFSGFTEAMLWWYQNTHEKNHIFAGATVHDRRMKAVAAAKRNSSTAEGELGKDEEVLCNKIFENYDTDRSGSISSKELRKMMTDLNGGIPPTATELKMIMWANDIDQSGYLNRYEFTKAITFWYLHTNPKATANGVEALSQVMVNPPEEKEKHSCCIIS
eukprot:TRINITY_DN2438_c0_g1_i2.p1 TRINITY_DN2438_c0_g1~~TRINITY_DN2438_c0_g1_i2.p1  ORF type:complete len:266 (+),score=48.37 TRINITY_DN2438_c0_g1_i2:37-834(+)